MKPQISVVIPFYNTIEYIQEAVDSIIQQINYVLEIILIDDGSNDGSSELVEKLYLKNSKIKIIHKQNEGQGVARNIGVELAKGNFIYFFDSDDILLPNLFSEFMQKLQNNPSLELFCFSGESFLDPKTSIEDVSKSYLSEKLYKRKISSCFNSGEDAFNSLIENNSFFAGPPFYIIKKSVLIINDLRFLKIKFEDEEFTHKLFIHAGLTIVSEKVYFRRRVRSGSTMQIKRTFNDLLGYIKTIETLAEIKKNKNLKDRTKHIIEQRIKTFIRLVIDIKVAHSIKLTSKEKKEFRSKLSPYLKNNSKLLFHYYFYPIEYNLRMLKKDFWDNRINV